MRDFFLCLGEQTMVFQVKNVAGGMSPTQLTSRDLIFLFLTLLSLKPRLQDLTRLVKDAGIWHLS